MLRKTDYGLDVPLTATYGFLEGCRMGDDGNMYLWILFFLTHGFALFLWGTGTLVPALLSATIYVRASRDSPMHLQMTISCIQVGHP